MIERTVRVSAEVDGVLLAVRLASEEGRFATDRYAQLLDWFRRRRGELVTGFDQFGTRRWSWNDFFAGRVTRICTEVVAGSPLTLTATLDTRTQTVWVISLSGG